MLKFDVKELSMDSLRSTMTLVRFSASEWGGIKNSDEATRAAKLHVHAVGDVGAFRKKLMASHDVELRKVRKVLRAARESHYALTRPYGHGVATIANAHMMQYLKTMGEHKKELAVVKGELLAKLPERITAAMSQLGDMANPSDYPDPDTIVKKFDMEFEFTPLPSVEVAGSETLPPGFAEKMQSALDARVRTHMQEGMKSGWRDVYMALEHLVIVVGNPETERYRSSLIGNVATAVRLSSAWNLLDNPQYDKLIAFINKAILARPVADLRSDADYREKVVANASKVMKLIKKQLDL